MTGKVSLFAIMACLATSLAFAGDKAKPSPCPDNAKTEAPQTASSDNVQQDGSGPDVGDKDKKKNKKNKKNAKPAPTDQEREFDRVLQGIFG